MKKIIITKFEYDVLVSCLDELYNISTNDSVNDKIMFKLGDTRRLFDLEMKFYNIRNDKQPPTKKELVQWILSKIKAKSLDL